jgi:leader peptidase (prepilin peptidase)/N-methyltransferase
MSAAPLIGADAPSLLRRSRTFRLLLRRPPYELALVAAAILITCTVSLWLVPGPLGALGAMLALLMLSIAAVDARYFIIPDVLVLTSLALGLAAAVYDTPSSAVEALWPALARAAALSLTQLLLRSIYKLIRGREGLGLGDVKLAAVAGAWLDWQMMAVALEAATVAALAAYVMWSVKTREIDKAVRLPFGLFFAPAIWLAWLIQARIAP